MYVSAHCKGLVKAEVRHGIARACERLCKNDFCYAAILFDVWINGAMTFYIDDVMNCSEIRC